MDNWYYVQGSERVGPIGYEDLRNLYLGGTLTPDSYVWKKGFQNWEHIRDIDELDFNVKALPKMEAARSKSSPEINFQFEWNNIGENEELFYIKIGNDRKRKVATNCYGPYSIIELKEAIVEKRISNHTLLFAAGLPGWIEVGHTPLNPINFKINFENFLKESPLVIAINHEPQPIVALVEKAGEIDCVLLGAGPFNIEQELLGSLYVGSNLKAKNVKFKILEFHPMEQKAFCKIIEVDGNAKKILQNYAE